jgi:hypothetical protein
VPRLPGREIDHSLSSGAEAETELNDTSSRHISGGSFKGYMCLMTKKKMKFGGGVYNQCDILLYYEIKHANKQKVK